MGQDSTLQSAGSKNKEINQYSYDINGISEDVIMDASSATDQDVRKIQRGHKLEEILFDIDSIRIEQAPEFGRKAIQRLGFENAGISSINVKREELINSTEAHNLLGGHLQVGSKVWYGLLRSGRQGTWNQHRMSKNEARAIDVPKQEYNSRILAALFCLYGCSHLVVVAFMWMVVSRSSRRWILRCVARVENVDTPGSDTIGSRDATAFRIRACCAGDHGPAEWFASRASRF